jgi:hypothetical protein
VQRLSRQRQVRVVHRVEAAAEQANAPLHFNQSRGGKKSLYRRDSGEPGSGVQS